MQPSKDLFELIRSMSGSEKRYFKIYASKHTIGEQNFSISLFDAIEAQEQYDEDGIKKKFKDRNEVKHLPFNKNYLYHLILDALHIYHLDISTSADLKKAIHRVEILFEKRLYDQCEKQLEKAKDLASKYEKYPEYLDLLSWEYEVARARGYRGKNEEDIRKIFDATFEMADKVKNANEYRLLTTQLFMRIMKGGIIRNDAGFRPFEKIIGHPLFSNENKATTFQSKYCFYHCHNAYYFTRQDYKHALEYGQKLVSLVESNPHQLEERLRAYVYAIQNVIVCKFNLKKYKEVVPDIKKLKSVETKSKALTAELFFIANNMELELCIHSGEFSKGTRLVPEIEKELERSGLGKQYETALYYHITLVQFGAGNFQAANKYLNRILNETEVDVRDDLQCFGRILSLIIHYEMGNEELLEYQVRNTYRYLLKRDRLYKVETVILEFIRKKMPKIGSPKELLAAFRELKSSLEKVTEDSFEKKALEYFDIISWLESKLSGKSFEEIVKSS